MDPDVYEDWNGSVGPMESVCWWVMAVGFMFFGKKWWCEI